MNKLKIFTIIFLSIFSIFPSYSAAADRISPFQQATTTITLTIGHKIQAELQTKNNANTLLLKHNPTTHFQVTEAHKVMPFSKKGTTNGTQLTQINLNTFSAQNNNLKQTKYREILIEAI